ncbi:MAG UNVERIFIED_CONTAM: hypothetical protein LVQ98_04210 [Rickettsiaceae bacterium]|jgi:hypothetical protein
MTITTTTNSPNFHTGFKSKLIGAMKNLNPFKTCMSKKERDIALTVATQASAGKTQTTQTFVYKSEPEAFVAALPKNPRVNTFLAEASSPEEKPSTPERMRRAASVYSRSGDSKISAQNYHDRAKSWLLNANNSSLSNPERIQAFTYAIDSAKYGVAMGSTDSVDLLCSLYRSGLENLVDVAPQEVSFWNNVKTKLHAPINPDHDFIPGSMNSLTAKDVKVARFIQMSSLLNKNEPHTIEHAQQYYTYLNSILDTSKAKGGDIPESVSSAAWNAYKNKGSLSL